MNFTQKRLFRGCAPASGKLDRRLTYADHGYRIPEFQLQSRVGVLNNYGYSIQYRVPLPWLNPFRAGYE